MADKAYLLSKISQFPNKPGVYLMKDDAQNIIYVGKAKDLKKRVGSYFSGDKDLKTEVLVTKIEDIEVIITGSEMQALIAENDLIKKYQPKYNINLKDGKTYPVIRITAEKYPRIFRTRRLVLDGSTYFGPFPNVEEIDTYLALIEKLFPLRKCRGPLKKRAHPCIYYHIGRCSAPCAGRISEQDYAVIVEKIKKLLRGDSLWLQKELSLEMKQAAQELHFEQAAHYRDQLQAVRHISELQKLTLSRGAVSDYLGMALKDKFAGFVVLKVRGGRVVGKEVFKTQVFSAQEEAFSQFTLQYYSRVSGDAEPPQAVYFPGFADNELVQALMERLPRGVRVAVPLRGKHRRMVALAGVNAEQDLRITSLDSLVELKIALNLPELPVRIEGFDIAHLGGEDTTASMVCFVNGRPEKSLYRKFKIKTLKGAVDDYEAIREVVARRYTRVLNEELSTPDLVLIDGGRGQLNAALSVLGTLGMEGVPVAGLAKQHEELFLPGREEALVLSRDSLALKLLQAVRDESHRFATTFHKKLRRKRASLSVLEKFAGIGRIKSRVLLAAFGSLEAIEGAAPEELARVARISKDRAEELLKGLKAEPGNRKKSGQ
jgi:excinuclease ABC subunit C